MLVIAVEELFASNIAMSLLDDIQRTNGLSRFMRERFEAAMMMIQSVDLIRSLAEWVGDESESGPWSQTRWDQNLMWSKAAKN